MSAYTRHMPSNPNKLLALLLAFIVAAVPMGGALAAGHACEGGSGDMTAMDHMQHAGDATVAISDIAGSDFFGSCQECFDGCCTGNTCSADACGASAVLAAISGLHLNAAHGVLNEDLGVSTISNRLTPPLRPPRA